MERNSGLHQGGIIKNIRYSPQGTIKGGVISEFNLARAVCEYKNRVVEILTENVTPEKINTKGKQKFSVKTEFGTIHMIYGGGFAHVSLKWYKRQFTLKYIISHGQFTEWR